LKRFLGFGALALAAFGVGCALVIDLGDEPKLRPADAGPVVEAGPQPEASAPDAGPPPVCGIADSTNAACADCIHQKCCDVGKTCAADPVCAAGLQCVKDCLVEIGCISDCLNKYPSVAQETNCSAFSCSLCTPKTQCSKLGQCVFNLPKDNLLRQVEEGRILDLDEQACTDARHQAVEQGQVDAGPCYD
jgi:hypothetical protein